MAADGLTITGLNVTLVLHAMMVSPGTQEDPSSRLTVFLVGMHVHPAPVEQAQEAMRELKGLAHALNCTVAGTLLQSRAAPHPRTFLGTGKVEQVRDLCRRHDVDVVLFNHDLSPQQGQALEQVLACMVWDRTQVILEIFARHARTAEAKVQVELARLRYMLPRLVGMWAHLDRERGGVGASRGMGEKQITIDRQIVRRRIAKLERTLQKIAAGRQTRTKRRKDCFRVALAGYTNAGKTSLMNLLTGTRLAAEDTLFATLDSTTRLLKAGVKPDIVLSDTVGFIRDLPHALVASFRSTLETVREADLLLQVVDAGHPERNRHIETTVGVLEGIGAADIPRLLVLNKADLLADEDARSMMERLYPGSVLVSALRPEHRARLLGRIRNHFRDCFFSHTYRLPYGRFGGLARLYENGIVNGICYAEDAMYVDCTISRANHRRIEKLVG